VLFEEKPLYYRPPKHEVKEPAIEGKGGPEHTALQDDIRSKAQEYGYWAIIEEQVPGGSVDVGLERDGKRIACEICVTCPDTHELGNIKKCLNAGYNKVILCSPEKKVLTKVRKLALKNLKKAERQKILFFLPEELTSYLKEEAAKAASTTERIRGYDVERHVKPVSEEKQEAKRRSILGVLWPFGRPEDEKGNEN